MPSAAAEDGILKGIAYIHMCVCLLQYVDVMSNFHSACWRVARACEHVFSAGCHIGVTPRRRAASAFSTCNPSVALHRGVGRVCVSHHVQNSFINSIEIILNSYCNNSSTFFWWRTSIWLDYFIYSERNEYYWIRTLILSLRGPRLRCILQYQTHSGYAWRT